MREGQAQAREDSGLCMQDSGLERLHTLFRSTLSMLKTLVSSYVPKVLRSICEFVKMFRVCLHQAVDDSSAEDAVWFSFSTYNHSQRVSDEEVSK